MLSSIVPHPYFSRNRLDDIGAAFSLHGLNAVHLPEHGWYRIDARGTRTDVDAQFTPPIERLAFHVSKPGEAEIPGLFADSLPVIVAALSSHSSMDELWKHLPDVDPQLPPSRRSARPDRIARGNQ